MNFPKGVRVIPLEQAQLVDIQLLQTAYTLARDSRDSSTQIAATLSSPHTGAIIAVGRNDIPEALADRPERRERPLKYRFTQHAERSVILSAASLGLRTEGLQMHCTWYACDDCALSIIDAGITRVVGHADIYGLNPRWDVGPALEMLLEAGVECVVIEGPMNRTVRVNGEDTCL